MKGLVQKQVFVIFVRQLILWGTWTLFPDVLQQAPKCAKGVLLMTRLLKSEDKRWVSLYEMGFLSPLFFSSSDGSELFLCSSSSPLPNQTPKGALVLGWVFEVPSVFWAKHVRPLTRGQTPTRTGRQTKITPSRHLCFLQDPLRHVTCVTGPDRHRAAPPVQGQGRSAQHRRDKENLLNPLLVRLGMSEKLIFPKSWVHFMVLQRARYNVKSPLAKDECCSNAMDMTIFLFCEEYKSGI